MPDVADGTVVDGRYKVLSRLGAGGMAEVYLAEDGQLGRKVALKLLHRRFAEDPDFVERFRREAQAAAGLQHPNVVSIYDRGEWDGTYYIAMEYLPGPSLKALIRQEAPLAPLRVIDIAIQILKAARFAHRQGIIHRDFKPHNVIVSDGDHVKVTDFGIARAGASDMTETGSIMGTAQYLSPEQAQGHAVSPASDLYSVGVILYEMLTGRVPFEADSAVTIAIKHVSESPTPPSHFNPSVPPELEQVVLWTLNKNPADRPADADALIAALQAARDAIEAGNPSERTASFAPVAATAVPVAVPLLGLEPDPVLLAPTPLPAELPPPEDPERGRGVWPWIILALVLLAAAGAAAAYVLTRTTQKTVPSVVNLQVLEAQTLVQNAGFTPNLIYRTDRHPQGTVDRAGAPRRCAGRQGEHRHAHRLAGAREHERPVGRRSAAIPGGGDDQAPGPEDRPGRDRDLGRRGAGIGDAHRPGGGHLGGDRLLGDAVRLLRQAAGERSRRDRRGAGPGDRDAAARRLPGRYPDEGVEHGHGG